MKFLGLLMIILWMICYTFLEASERCCPACDTASPAQQPWQTIAPASHN